MKTKVLIVLLLTMLQIQTIHAHQNLATPDSYGIDMGVLQKRVDSLSQVAQLIVAQSEADVGNQMVPLDNLMNVVDQRVSHYVAFSGGLLDRAINRMKLIASRILGKKDMSGYTPHMMYTRPESEPSLQNSQGIEKNNYEETQLRIEALREEYKAQHHPVPASASSVYCRSNIYSQGEYDENNDRALHFKFEEEQSSACTAQSKCNDGGRYMSSRFAGSKWHESSLNVQQDGLFGFPGAGLQFDASLYIFMMILGVGAVCVLKGDW